MSAPRLRVAVVTTEARPVFNALWFAARERGADVRLISDEQVAPPLPPFQIALPASDFGRGLIYRHLHGLRQVLDQIRADVIHINGELWSLTVQEMLTRPEPIVVHGAENLWRHGNVVERLLRDRLVRRSIHRLDGYVSWNEAGRRHVAERVGSDVPTLTLPAIIPPPEFRRGSWTRPPTLPHVLLLVGNLVWQKGFDTVVAAVAGTADPCHYRIEVCGVGPQGSALRVQARSLGVDLVLLGHLSATQLAHRMALAWCLVQPSRAMPDNLEQFGRNIAECTTVGLPAVVSDCGELPRALGTPEAVFPQCDATALGRVLERLREDRAFYDALRRRQHALSARWASGTTAQQIVEFWERVGARHARGRNLPGDCVTRERGCD